MADSNNVISTPLVSDRGRVAVLLSGRGSNFEAIYRSSLLVGANFEVVVVISDKEDAPGLNRAKEWGIPAFSVPYTKKIGKAAYEKLVVEILHEYNINLVCLAGYMRIAGKTLLDAYPDAVMNIHPALLPSFPGVHAQKQALDYGVKVSGCTVHFVDIGMDSGPIILQKAVAVLENDTEEILGQRILKEEHQLYSQAISLFFQKRLKIFGRRVIISL